MKIKDLVLFGILFLGVSIPYFYHWYITYNSMTLNLNRAIGWGSDPINMAFRFISGLLFYFLLSIVLFVLIRFVLKYKP